MQLSAECFSFGDERYLNHGSFGVFLVVFFTDRTVFIPAFFLLRKKALTNHPVKKELNLIKSFVSLKPPKFAEATALFQIFETFDAGFFTPFFAVNRAILMTCTPRAVTKFALLTWRGSAVWWQPPRAKNFQVKFVILTWRVPRVWLQPLRSRSVFWLLKWYPGPDRADPGSVCPVWSHIPACMYTLCPLHTMIMNTSDMFWYCHVDWLFLTLFILHNTCLLYTWVIRLYKIVGGYVAAWTAWTWFLVCASWFWFFRSLSLLPLQNPFRVLLLGPGYSSDIAGDGPSKGKRLQGNRNKDPLLQANSSSQIDESPSQVSQTSTAIELENTSTVAPLVNGSPVTRHSSSSVTPSFNFGSFDPNQPDEEVDYGEVQNEEVPSQNAFNVENNRDEEHAFNDENNRDEETRSVGVNDDEIHRPSLEDLLIAISFKQFVFLLEGIQTLRHIPNKVEKEFRKVYIKLMQAIERDPKNSIAWKKFLLLPIVILSLPGKDNGSKQTSNERVKEIRRRIVLVSNDDWSQFTFGSLPKRKPFSSRPLSDEKKEAHRQSKVEQLSYAGEFSKAMKRLISKTGMPSASAAVYTALLGLHPDKTDYVIQANLLQDMLNCHNALITNSMDVFEITGPKLRKWINKKSDFVSPGLDGLRWEHLRSLCGTGRIENPDEETFVNLLAKIISLLLDVKNVPSEVFDALRDNVLMPIEKDPNDPTKIRPIGMGYMIRKLCSTVCLTYVYQAHVVNGTSETFLKTLFGGLQFGMESKGAEKVFHAMNFSFQKHPERDLFVADGINGFIATT